ncbi:uncharacterized protein A4U43_C05F30150 [Asparagus officinalis]|uniref:TOD1/MUCI70 glycosyltransferase-like domain-containing protein n=1 Tax=Asparagus officinalis TaxID=4686 RepID=A0A5P1EW01_ASPOF|nr:uncharacterized protein LOC109840904 [Asparagus officinalis]ONK70092.1 uncharacterized protein A4U43_C05F30150 [Asparagus officinalis]
MTGGSLGLRSGSYGSLQQVHNSLCSVSTLPITSTPVSVRKNSKMLLPGSREKERRLSAIFKIASRKKVGMLLLLIITSIAVVLSFFFAVSRDVDQPAGPETVVGYSDHVWNLVNRGRMSSHFLSPPPVPAIEQIQQKENIMPVPNIQHAKVMNTTLLPFFHPLPIPSRHPCENFSLPPSPVNPKRTGPRPCDVCYVPVDLAMSYMPTLPSASPVLKNLYYVSEENLVANESNGGSIFGGHPSLQQREESFDIKETMTVYCGFAKGKKPGQGTGFNIDEADLLEMEQCHGVVVASAIFGNYDIMQQPRNISEASKQTVCFFMFVDEETEASIKNSSSLDNTRKIGLWRVVVVRNLPYSDARRTGKVPKLLLHRLFPNARFSIWIDGKLELVVDPYQILERFLWRNNATFAISRHYRRFDVFEEADANKAAGKYDNASIDYQIEFYKKEGLTHFSPDKYPITSDVPEGCVIIKEHIPITNLFTCLWFNEVDRFTSRDQLSYSTTRDKLSSKTNWTPYMFMDCERRNFVVQAYHRDLLEQRRAAQNQHPPRSPINELPSPVKELPRKSTSEEVHNLEKLVTTPKSTSPRKQSSRRGKGRSGSKRHRLKGAASIRDPNSL